MAIGEDDEEQDEDEYGDEGSGPPAQGKEQEADEEWAGSGEIVFSAGNVPAFKPRKPQSKSPWGENVEVYKTSKAIASSSAFATLGEEDEEEDEEDEGDAGSWHGTTDDVGSGAHALYPNANAVEEGLGSGREHLLIGTFPPTDNDPCC